MFSERLRQFIEHTGKSITSFEASIDVSKGAIAKPIKNKKSVGAEVLDKILSNYPDLNLEWLVSGFGEMLKNKPVAQPQAQVKSSESDNLITITKDEYIQLTQKALKEEKAKSQELQKKLEQVKND